MARWALKLSRVMPGYSPPKPNKLDASALRAIVKAEAASLQHTRRELRQRLKELFDLKRTPSGMTACLLYLTLFLNERVQTRELEVVSGIPQYARRLRQLRVEEGFDIVTESGQGIGWTYKLTSAVPNASKAELWKKRNYLRRLPGSGEARILATFKAFIGTPVDISILTYVSKIQTARERVRDLRLHKGWRIFSHFTGRPDLEVTEYVMESEEQLPTHDREIPDNTYEETLLRDGSACVKCRWSPRERVQGSRKQFIEVHHKQLHSKSGTHEKKNLVTLCNMHHDEVHRLKIDEHTIGAWLEEK